LETRLLIDFECTVKPQSTLDPALLADAQRATSTNNDGDDETDADSSAASFDSEESAPDVSGAKSSNRVASALAAGDKDGLINALEAYVLCVCCWLFFRLFWFVENLVAFVEPMHARCR
jgi:hypothetical protein